MSLACEARHSIYRYVTTGFVDPERRSHCSIIPSDSSRAIFFITDEIFALLIVAIFVIDAVGDPFSSSGILMYFDSSHKSHAIYAGEEDYEYLTVALLSKIWDLEPLG